MKIKASKRFKKLIEISKNKQKETIEEAIKKVKENRDKIKVIYANKNELEAHKNYFQN